MCVCVCEQEREREGGRERRGRERIDQTYTHNVLLLLSNRSVDPQVILDASGKKGSLFDSVEDLVRTSLFRVRVRGLEQ